MFFRVVLSCSKYRSTDFTGRASRLISGSVHRHLSPIWYNAHLAGFPPGFARAHFKSSSALHAGLESKALLRTQKRRQHRIFHCFPKASLRVWLTIALSSVSTWPIAWSRAVTISPLVSLWPRPSSIFFKKNTLCLTERYRIARTLQHPLQYHTLAITILTSCGS